MDRWQPRTPPRLSRGAGRAAPPPPSATEGVTHSEGAGESIGSPAAGEPPAERAGEGVATAADPTDVTTTAVTDVHSEQVFGLNPDATGLVIAALAASVLMAVAVWRYPAVAPLLVLVALASLAFCVFDVREAFHQVSESRTSLVAIAALVVALHLTAAAVATTMSLRTRRDRGRPSPQVV